MRRRSHLFFAGDYHAIDGRAAGQYVLDEQACVIIDQGNPASVTMARPSSALLRRKSAISCTTGVIWAGAATLDRGGILLSIGLESIALDTHLVSGVNA